MKKNFLLGLLLASASALSLAAPDPVKASTTYLPPMSLDLKSERPGAMVELVRELSRRTGVPVDIALVPWGRAMFLTGNLPRNAIFPLTRTDEREQKFRWLVRLYQEHYVFVATRDGGRFDVEQPEAMKAKRIGVLRGSAMNAELRAMGYTNLVESGSVDEGRRFLTRGIVDAMIGDRDIVARSLKGLPESKTFVMSDTVRKTSSWLGGSLDFTEADAALFQAAMKGMVTDGTYARILKSYALSVD